METKYEEALARISQIADSLLEKVGYWVENLDPQEAGAQSIRQICAILKDLKDLQKCQQEEEEYRLKLKKLSRDLEETDSTLTVTIAGGEEAWQR